MVYNSDLFDRERMVTMLDQLHLLLDQIVTAPDKLISDYSLLDADSQAKLPDPRITISEPRLEPITEAIMAQAPSNTAICKGEQKWTYAELASRAEQIARALVADGLSKGEVVAVIGPPGFGLIAGMLGVFRSGGVLLTLDPNLPSERQQLMLREAGARRALYVAESDAEDIRIRETFSLKLLRIEDGALSEAGNTELPTIEPNDPARRAFRKACSAVTKD
jgi:non-ribosomal peptide synthetase component F